MVDKERTCKSSIAQPGATFNAKGVTAPHVAVDCGHDEIIRLQRESHSLLEADRLKTQDIEALLHGKWSGS